MPPLVRQICETFLGQDKNFFKVNWKKRWTKLCDRVGVNGLQFRDLRRSGAVRMLAHCKNLALVQDMLRHADPKTTRIYALVQNEELTGVANTFLSDLPVVHLPMEELQKPRLLEEKIG